MPGNDILQTIIEKEAQHYALSFQGNRDRQEGFADGWHEAMRFLVDYVRLTFDVDIKDNDSEAYE